MSIAYSRRESRLSSAQIAAVALCCSFSWIVVALLVGSRWPAYSFRQHAISGLAAAPGGWLFNLGLFASGSGAAIFGYWFGGRLPEFRGRQKVRWLMLGFGAGYALLGVFTAPGGVLTTGSTLHAASFAGAMLCLIRALELIGDRLAHTRGWEGFARYSDQTRVAVLVLIVLMLAMFSPMSPLAVLRLGGAAEWALLITVWAWLASCGRHAGAFEGVARARP